MKTSRRQLLKGLVTGGAGVALGGCSVSGRAPRELDPDAVGMLYDSTRCIGCKACVVACRRANGTPPETDGPGQGLYDAPRTLSGDTKNIIKLHAEDGNEAYMKAQCMHCVDPACVSVCMISALHKAEHGIVAYDPDKCIGCRYCQVACPFNVPGFQWETATPLIVKCELCRHLLASGGEPGCCAVCPREAVIYGRRDQLLQDAKQRLREHPDRYVPKVYGETDGGGTQVLYLAGVPFEKLGLPALGAEPVPDLAESLQHAIYQGFVAPVVLYAALGVAIYRNRNNHQGKEHDHDGPQ